MKKIQIYGTRWCGDCRRALRILDERQVAYHWIDIDQNPEAEAFVKQTNRGNRSMPTIIFPDDSVLVEPSSHVLIQKLAAFEL